MLFVVILTLAVSARLHHIQTQSLWFDEGWSAYAGAQPTLAAAANADLTNPPLYYVLLNLTTRFLGDSEFSLRLFSLFAGLFVMALSYRLAGYLFGSPANLYAALLAASSPLLWWASQEARMYTLLAALVTVCAWAWHRLYVRPTIGAWLALWVSELALLYAHNTGPVVALWLNVATFVAWLVNRRIDGPFSWRLWISGQVLVAVLWSPYFFARYVDLAAANSAVTSAPQLTPEFGRRIWQAFWQTPWERVLLSGESPLPYLALLLILMVIVQWRRATVRWLLLHCAVLIAGLIAALIVLGNEMHGRYLVMVAPLLLVSIGGGIARLRARMLRFALVGLLVAIFVFNLIYAQTSDYRHDDARAMVQYYSETLDADDSALIWSYADRYELAYYWDRLGVQARRVTLPEGNDLDTVLPLLPESGDVALNVWYTQRADYRGMMPCVLGNGTINEPEQHTVYGMTNLLYPNPSLNLPELAAVDLPFSDDTAPIARVVAHGQIRSATIDRAQCIPVQIELLRDVNVELKAALIVHNPLGWEIARADGVFATADQRTSAALPPGVMLTAYPLLRLPYGAPPGAYRVFLRLYDEIQLPSGYIPPVGVTNSGRDGLLGAWEAPPGAEWEPVNRETMLTTPVETIVRQNLTLIAHDGTLNAESSVANGSEIRVTLLWRGTGVLPDLTLLDTDGRWSVDVPPLITVHDSITLDWRSVRVPADAPSGLAELRLLNGTVIGHYTIESLPMTLEAPAFNHSVAVEFPGVGELVGYSLSDPITLDVPPTLTLIWRAGESPSDVSYTVFAQLLNTEGRVIAQSDSIPKTGTRPTTGWRTGEYIEDAHMLIYNDLAAPGEAALIVGLYDTTNNQRLRLAENTDYVVLSDEVEVR
jgi:hypothetical protein